MEPIPASAGHWVFENNRFDKVVFAQAANLPYLELTDGQVRKLEPILDQEQRQMLAFRRETSLSRQQRIVRLKQMRETDDAQFKLVLSPEQFEKWRNRGSNLQGTLQTADERR